MKVSASDIAAFKYCPRDFYYKKIEKKTFPPTQALVKGTLIHAIYKEFFDRKLFSDSKYLKWFLKKGIERVMEKEASRINRLGMNKEELRRFLSHSLKKLNESYLAGNLSAPILTEQRFENDEFIAKIDALFGKILEDDKTEFQAIGDVKIRLRNLDEVKLQIAVASIILSSYGKDVKRGLAIDAERWLEVEFFINDELKKEVWEIREQILKLYETKEKPPCKCGRCDLYV